MNTALAVQDETAVATRQESALSTFFDPLKYEQMAKVSGVFAASSFVPAPFKGSKENCFIALSMAQRIDTEPLFIMQNMYVVHNRPAFSVKFAIAMANSRGPFKGPIKYRKEGSGTTLKITAYAIMRDTGEEVSAWASMEMAKAEGWTSNAKYRTMPENMLHWRAAGFLINRYCPEVLMGMPILGDTPNPGASAESLNEKLGTASPLLPETDAVETKPPKDPVAKKKAAPPKSKQRKPKKGEKWAALITPEEDVLCRKFVQAKFDSVEGGLPSVETEGLFQEAAQMVCEEKSAELEAQISRILADLGSSEDGQGVLGGMAGE